MKEGTLVLIVIIFPFLSNLCSRWMMLLGMNFVDRVILARPICKIGVSKYNTSVVNHGIAEMPTVSFNILVT